MPRRDAANFNSKAVSQARGYTPRDRRVCGERVGGFATPGDGSLGHAKLFPAQAGVKEGRCGDSSPLERVAGEFMAPALGKAFSPAVPFDKASGRMKIEEIEATVDQHESRSIRPPVRRRLLRSSGLPRLAHLPGALRHPQIQDAIGMSFWVDPSHAGKNTGKIIVAEFPRILAFRPDNRAGRVGQQSSCFTMHTHLAKPQTNNTLVRLKIVGSKKGAIRDELRQLNINEFTVYHDLDHLSKEIKRGWGV
jgi:hypothetical protein